MPMPNEINLRLDEVAEIKSLLEKSRFIERPQGVSSSSTTERKNEMSMPNPINFTPEEATEIKSLLEKGQSIDRFCRQVVEQGQAMTQQTQSAINDFWARFSKKHNIDTDRVLYAPAKDFAQAIPVQMKLG